MQLALKIDVETYRGTREGVPQLLEMLRRQGVQASFFFALGPDRTGRAINNFFRRGFPGSAASISLLKHYGIKTLLYGTLLPAPDIGKQCADVMREVRDHGFEVGLHCYENSRWQNQVAHKNAQWTRCEMDKAVKRFAEIFGEPPRASTAPGWQLNRDALRMTQRLGFDYVSGTRGFHPYIPTWDAEIIACPQLPTTLPTLDEFIARDGVTEENAVTEFLRLTEGGSPKGHVFSLRAEVEGGKWLPIFERLVIGWKSQGYEIVSLQQYLQNTTGDLPRHAVRMDTISGRNGKLAVQV